MDVNTHLNKLRKQLRIGDPVSAKEQNALMRALRQASTVHFSGGGRLFVDGQGTYQLNAPASELVTSDVRVPMFVNSWQEIPASGISRRWRYGLTQGGIDINTLEPVNTVDGITFQADDPTQFALNWNEVKNTNGAGIQGNQNEYGIGSQQFGATMQPIGRGSGGVPSRVTPVMAWVYSVEAGVTIWMFDIQNGESFVCVQ